MFRLRRYIWTLASASFLFNRSSNQSNIPPSPPTEIPRTTYDHLNCTGFECLRQSSMIALTASSNFFKHTLYYYSELAHRYSVHICSMISILEEFQRQEGRGEIQQDIWNIYVKERVTANEMKNELLRLRLLLSTIERQVNESIEASYQTNDETVTQLVTSELNNAKILIDQNEQTISKHEMNLTSAQVKLIEPVKEEKN